jgi:hypothetical protein
MDDAAYLKSLEKDSKSSHGSQKGSSKKIAEPSSKKRKRDAKVSS